jgi:hypothetical protein
VKLEPRETGNLASSSALSCVDVAVCARQDWACTKLNAIVAYGRFMMGSHSGLGPRPPGLQTLISRGCLWTVDPVGDSSVSLALASAIDSRHVM